MPTIHIAIYSSRLMSLVTMSIFSFIMSDVYIYNAPFGAPHRFSRSHIIPVLNKSLLNDISNTKEICSTDHVDIYFSGYKYM